MEVPFENAPDWLKISLMILTPIAGWFSRDFFNWWKERVKRKEDQQDKFIERRVSRVDNEIERVLKLKDERIEDMKKSLSEKNLQVSALQDEVKLCRHEREQFVIHAGETAAQLAETKANLAHANAELAERDLEIARLKNYLHKLEPRAAVLDDAKGDAKQLYKKLEGGSDPAPTPDPTPSPAPP